MDSNESRLDTKFNVILGIFAILISALGFLGYSSLKQELFTEQLSVNEAKTEALAGRIDLWLSTRKTEISTLANTPVVRSMDWAISGPYLKAKHQTWPWFYIFAHINPDGTYYNSKVDFAKGQNLSDRAHFLASIEGQVYASDPIVSRTLGTSIVAVTSPIYSDDSAAREIIGVFGGMIDTSTIVDELARFSNGPNSYAFALNSTGVAIAHPDEARRGNINTKATSLLEDADPGVKRAATEMLKGEPGWFKAVIDGVDSYVTYTPVSEANWYIATVTPSSFIDRQFVVLDYAGIFVAIFFITGLVLVWRYRRMEFETLNKRRELSEERSKAKSVFLANMSHELRTPLNGILGYSQILLASHKPDDPARKSLEIILSSGRHLLMLINRVLDLSKIEAGRLELEERAVSPAILFQDLIQIFEIERAKHNCSFTTEISPELPEAIRVDPEKLTQVVTNIVVNAFKYGNQSPVTLRVGCDTATRELQIEVRDQGRGMTREQLARVFIPFEQASNKSDGAGLGLAIVSELLKLMGGRIDVQSQPGSGTQVSISLPYALSDEAVVNAPANLAQLPTAIASEQPVRILIVDDNPQNRDFLKALLTPIGFTISEAGDGVEALQQLEQNSFELVITDLVMPNMDGFDLIAQLRSRQTQAELPIIVASASAFSDDQVRSLALGANAFLSKPIDSFDLLNKIASATGIRYAGDESGVPASSPCKAGRAEIDWSLEINQQLRTAIYQAAELGQIQKVTRLIDAIEAPELRTQWHCLLDEALDEHDDEQILTILERSHD